MATNSTIIPTSRAQNTAVLITVGVLVTLIGVLLVTIEQRSAPMRAAAAHELAAELAAESKLFCEKHGMPSGVQTHAACVTDVQVIRDGQTGRMSRDHQFGL